jgi:two-component system, NtrC family, sensor kinase
LENPGYRCPTPLSKQHPCPFSPLFKENGVSMDLNIEQVSLIYVIPPILGCVMLFGLALISILRGRKNPANIFFAGICIIGAIVNAKLVWVSMISDQATALKVERFLYLFIVFAVPFFIQFVHLFLHISGRKWLECIAYLLSFTLLFFTQTDLFISGLQRFTFGTISKAGPVFFLFAAMAGFVVLYCLSVLYAGMRRATDSYQKNRIKYILGGLGINSLLVALNILTVFGFNIYPMGNFTFIPAIFLAFGVLKYDLLDMGAVIRRGTIYFILTGILTLFYVLVISLFNTLFVGSRYDRSLVFPFVLALFIVFLFNPLRQKVQTFIDNLFFRGKYDYQRTLKEISGEMASLLKFEQIKNLLLQSILAALQVTHLYLFAYDDEKGYFRQYSGKNEDPNDIGMNIFEQHHPVVGFLENVKRPLSKSVVEHSVSAVDEKNQIFTLFDVLDVLLIVPIISKTRLIGVIALGQKKSGELFVPEDLELLMTIANQSATAVENARAYEEIEKLNCDLEKKVEERTADLRLALEEKERTQKQLIQSESLAAIGQLVAGAAHELNNPLASASSLIQISAETIGEWDIAADKRSEVVDELTFSLKELKRVADIVRALLDLSRQTQVYVEPVNINRAIDDALRVLQPQYKYLHAEIEKRYDEKLPQVEGNFANLGQVFINVIKNAMESLPDGTGNITLSTCYKRGKHCIVIECRDTGIGIAAENQKNIFQPFFTTKPAGKGTGLGLYISHEIIRKHGGEIYVKSEKDIGTVFSIELPCKT